MTGIDRCVRCGRIISMFARGLCHTCYQSSKRDGTIYDYPTIPQRSHNRPTVCCCAKPLVERLELWDCYQCARCGRLITPERMDELGEIES